MDTLKIQEKNEQVLTESRNYLVKSVYAIILGMFTFGFGTLLACIAEYIGYSKLKKHSNSHISQFGEKCSIGAIMQGTLYIPTLLSILILIINLGIIPHLIFKTLLFLFFIGFILNYIGYVMQMQAYNHLLKDTEISSKYRPYLQLAPKALFCGSFMLLITACSWYSLLLYAVMNFYHLNLVENWEIINEMVWRIKELENFNVGVTMVSFILFVALKHYHLSTIKYVYKKLTEVPSRLPIISKDDNTENEKDMIKLSL